MFAKSDIDTKLTAEINAALDKLEKITDKSSDEYGNLIDRIAKLHKLKTEERPRRINPDHALVAGTNLLGIVLILQHERLHVVASKALGFVIKSRS